MPLGAAALFDAPIYPFMDIGCFSVRGAFHEDRLCVQWPGGCPCACGAGGQGSRPHASARRGDRLEALREDLGDRLVPIVADVAVDADCERLVADAIAIDGHLDVLGNNAGIGTAIAAELEPIGYFRNVVDVNLNALFLLSQLRSEEHTSELQSLMRISYAVFCLKKK